MKNTHNRSLKYGRVDKKSMITKRQQKAIDNILKVLEPSLVENLRRAAINGHEVVSAIKYLSLQKEKRRKVAVSKLAIGDIVTRDGYQDIFVVVSLCDSISSPWMAEISPINYFFVVPPMESPSNTHRDFLTPESVVRRIAYAKDYPTPVFMYACGRSDINIINLNLKADYDTWKNYYNYEYNRSMAVAKAEMLRIIEYNPLAILW